MSGQKNSSKPGVVFSAILGGCGNTVSHAYAAFFGKGVSYVVDSAFHANNFVAQNMPSTSVGLPSGALWYDTSNIVHRVP